MKWNKIEYDDDGFPVNPPPNGQEVLFMVKEINPGGDCFSYTHVMTGEWSEEDDIFICTSGRHYEWQDLTPDYWTEYSEDGVE